MARAVAALAGSIFGIYEGLGPPRLPGCPHQRPPKRRASTLAAAIAAGGLILR